MTELHVSTTAPSPSTADVAIMFGDDVGFQVIQNMFDHLEGYVVAINGQDYTFKWCEQLPDDWAFVVRDYPSGPTIKIRVGDVTSFHIF